MQLQGITTRRYKIIEDNKLYRLDYKQSFNQLRLKMHRLNKGISDKVTINPYNRRQV
jgi:hypothetical protein